MNMLYESCGYVSGHTFPVEQLFLEDILDKTNYVLEENSLNARKMKKSGTLVPGDITSLECELEMADIQESTAVIKNAATRDENLTASQLYYRYKSKFCRVFNVGIIIAACYMWSSVNVMIMWLECGLFRLASKHYASLAGLH